MDEKTIQIPAGTDECPGENYLSLVIGGYGSDSPILAFPKLYDSGNFLDILSSESSKIPNLSLQTVPEF